MNRVKSLKVSDSTHAHLKRLGGMYDTMDGVIMSLVVEHIGPIMTVDFDKIKELCGESLVLKKTPSGVPEPERVMSWDVEVQSIKDVFDEIDFDYGIYPEWSLDDAIEMASDEDQVGGAVCFGDRDLSLAEVCINTYCLYLDMPSPTFGNGALRVPF